MNKHLGEFLEIMKFYTDTMPVKYVCGLFKLSEASMQDSSSNVNEEDGSEDEAQDLRDEGEVYLLRRNKGAMDFGNENVYDRWVPILWR